jgi:hypothetical protein
MPKFLLQTSHHQGVYRNPFKPGGYGDSFSKWRTTDKFDTLEQAQEAWKNFNQSGLQRRRIVFTGKVMITDDGRVFEIVDNEAKFKGRI